jgi:hypothetical protein
MSAPASTRDLLPSERRFLDELRRVGYGRFERLRISAGELVLSPPPLSIRTVKFGSTPLQRETRPSEFDLKKQVAEFFEHVREIEEGEIRVLEVRAGLPFLMEIEQRPERSGGATRA